MSGVDEGKGQELDGALRGRILCIEVDVLNIDPWPVHARKQRPGERSYELC
jgi:hypothetical protein